jgi:TATA-box binding protein (TBP) (component of TFIID and TFIIIB)
MAGGRAAAHRGLPHHEIAARLGINPLDVSSVQLEDLAIGDSILESVPTASNMVIVANPPDAGEAGAGAGGETPVSARQIDLEAVALARPGCQLNHRRFAAVKTTYGSGAGAAGTAPTCGDNALADWQRQAGAGAGAGAGGESLAWLQRCTVLLFRSKRWVCTGATHPDEALMCILRAASDIREIYPWFPNPVCEIQNIVASARLFPAMGAGAGAGAPAVSAGDADLLSGCDFSQAGSLPKLAGLAGAGAGAGAGAEASARKRKRGPKPHRALPLREITDMFGLQGNYRPELFPGAIVRVDGVCFLVFDSGACVITGAKTPRQMAREYRDFMWHISANIYTLSKRDPSFAWLRRVLSPWLLRHLKHADVTGTLNPKQPPVPRIIAF